MKNLLLVFLLIPIFSSAQNFDPYKYVHVIDIVYDDGTKDKYGLSTEIRNNFMTKGFTVIRDNQLEDFLSNNDPCELLRVSSLQHRPVGIWRQSVTIEFVNCLNNVVFTGSAKAGNDMSSADRDIRKAGSKILDKALRNYSFDNSLTPKLPVSKFDVDTKKLGFNINSEASIRKYFDNNSAELIEGIWGYNGTGNANYKLLILKDNFTFKAIILEGNNFWKKGDLKAEFEPAAVDEIMSVKWTMGNKVDKEETIATVKNNAIIEFELAGSKTQLYKIYPKLSNQKEVQNINIGEGWRGNGSGIIISESGYIITNYHVVENAREIEVEFMLNDEVQNFNAEVVQVDKTNDLALIKIFDLKFDGLNEISYNFKSRTSDVGTQVYAFGYPMALTVMGKEIKVTDGIISSKTGFDGDITTYQITAAIQEGNSGGPLFDNEGNLVGINSSGIRKDLADNVAYSIKTSYVINLIDILPNPIELPSSSKLQSLPLTEKIKEISKYVVLIKVK